MGKKDETIVKKTTTVQLFVGQSGTSTIVRENGLPQIIDKTEKAVSWLKGHDIKPTDVEIIGEKPANWDIVFAIVPISDPADVTAVLPEIIPESAIETSEVAPV